MKKRFLIIIAAIITFNSIAYSQGFHMGIKFGSDIQKITGASFTKNFAFGYHLGGFAEIKLNKKYSIQPEIYYSAVNFDTATGFSTVYNSVGLSKLKFGYFNMPILLNMKPSKGLSIQVGPRFSILTDKNLAIKSNAKSALNSGDFAMIAGFQLNLTKIKVYGRYEIGLSNLNDITSDSKWKTQTIHLGIGLKIF